MICFRDTTFCPFWEDCQLAPACRRPLTEQVREDARLWWGGPDAPVAVFTTPPPCHVPLRAPE